MARVSYLGFLMSFLKNIQGKEMNVSNSSIFKRLIVKYINYFRFFISKRKLKEFLKIIYFNYLRLYQSSLKSNSNGKSCFILSILFDIQNKENTFLENYSTGHNLNLKLFYEKHKTKLANYGQ